MIDFGQYIAGPLAAMFLADHGADVTLVDPSGGPRYASPANATWNRGRRSIVLDLERAAASPGADGIDVLASIEMADDAERLAATGAFWREPLPIT